MTNKQIEQAEKELYKILREDINDEKRCDKLHSFAVKINATVPPGQLKKYTQDYINAITSNIHTVLQTEMMLNACNYSKLACKWAAIAATVAAIGVIASWSIFLHKMIFQILKVFLNRF